jgi:hypothetical protein
MMGDAWMLALRALTAAVNLVPVKPRSRTLQTDLDAKIVRLDQLFWNDGTRFHPGDKSRGENTFVYARGKWVVDADDDTKVWPLVYIVSP